MTSVLRLQAPAKLNLYLRVVAHRPDGYHELETLFERIDLADELTFTPQALGITVTCDAPTLGCGPENLVTQAALRLQQACGVTQGAAIHLRKRVPIAGGLGGGSSDAATALLGLNRLWTLKLSTPRLRELAAGLGSDVPFFLQPEAFAIGRGRGEQCEPLSGPLPILWHVLVVPPEGLSTKAVYEGFDRSEKMGRSLTERGSSIRMCLHALRNGSLGELAEGLQNDLEPEAIRRCPVIQEICTSLRRSGCVGVLTSGSGPSVFGLCQDAAHAEQVTQRIQETGASAWRVRVVKTLSTLPGDHDEPVA